MQKYHYSLRILHWVVAILTFCMIGVGFYMTGYAVAPQKYEMYATHKSLGMTIFFLLVLRFFLRKFLGIPDMPRQLSKFEKVASKIVHYFLYLLLLFAALSGYVMSSAGGRAMSWFYLFDVPLLIPLNKYVASFAHDLHSVLPYILLAIIALHILAALKHVLIDKVNIIKRII